MKQTPLIERLKKRFRENKNISLTDLKIPLSNGIPTPIVRDILEQNVDEKYFIPKEKSDHILRIAYLKKKERENADAVGKSPDDGEYVRHHHLTQNGKLADKLCATITSADAPHVVTVSNEASTGKKSQGSSVYDEGGLFPTISAGCHGYSTGYIAAEEDQDIL